MSVLEVGPRQPCPGGAFSSPLAQRALFQVNCKHMSADIFFKAAYIFAMIGYGVLTYLSIFHRRARSSPSGVRGPVLFPPCIRHRPFRIAG